MSIIANKTNLDFSVKVATFVEWQNVVEMARNERWNLGLGDDAIFFKVDNKGFIVSVINGEVAASISVVNYSPDYAHLGHYIVRPEYRGKGLGLALWSAAIEHAGMRCIGLDAMPEQENNYSKWGFKTYHRTYRMQGRAAGCAAKVENVLEVMRKHLPAIITFDAKFTGYSRSELLSQWLTGDNRQAFILMENQDIRALIALRLADEGYRIGPFYAEEQQHAMALLQTALASIPANAPVTLDIPEQASEIIDDLSDIGFKKLFHTCRMYRGTPPSEYRKGLNAITSLELG